MEAQMVAQQAEYNGPIGLEDGERIKVECDTCGKELLTIWVTRPGFVMQDGTLFEGDYKAECPHCGNFSKTHHVVGGFAIINPAEKMPNGGERVISSWHDQREVDGVTILMVKKL